MPHERIKLAWMTGGWVLVQMEVAMALKTAIGQMPPMPNADQELATDWLMTWKQGP